jgi:hypothetical protein
MNVWSFAMIAMKQIDGFLSLLMMRGTCKGLDDCFRSILVSIL